MIYPQTQSQLNVIESAELIYDHLYSDEHLTLGQLYEANTFTMFISMLYEAGMAKVHPLEICKAKPKKYTEVIDLVMDCLVSTEVFQDERMVLINLCETILVDLLPFSSYELPACPSRQHLRIL